MALRDPGAPRRNPLFAVDGSEVDATPDVTPDDDPTAAPGDGAEPAAAPWSALGASLFDGSLLEGSLRSAPGSTVGPWMTALQEAGPEAAEHLVNAAHELTLAVKVVVDSVERTLAEQRDAFAAERSATDEHVAEGHEARADDDPSPASRVRRIDVE